VLDDIADKICPISPDDPMVRFEGCCDNQETQCCCAISRHGPRDGSCVSADAGKAWQTSLVTSPDAIGRFRYIASCAER